MQRIDSHQHFWDPDAGSYPWMEGPDMAPIRRVFEPAELASLARAQSVSRCITVQCRHDLDETRWMLGLSAQHELVAGVVGWVDLTSQMVGTDIAGLQRGAGGGALVGIRHNVHDEVDARWLDRADVRRGLTEVFRADLSYDLLLKPRDLPAAIRAVAAFPEGRFIVDHGAKPRIGNGRVFDTEWADLISEIAGHGNVWCKISGLVTEAHWQSWTYEDLRPYLAHLFSAFGPHHLIFGSDWPVCTLAAAYGEVVQIARRACADFDLSEQRLFCENCRTAYALSDHS